MNQQHNRLVAEPPVRPDRSERAPLETGLEQSSGLAAPPARQPVMSDSEFARLTAMLRALTGIVLPPHKRPLVISRLRRRLNALDIGSYAAYLAYLEGPGASDETAEIINVITTNLTSFFREGHHFEDLAQVLARRAGQSGPARLRIWSAACSTGEEPYSIAITSLRAGLAAPGTDLRILATDIDTSVLNLARAATYPAGRIDSCSRECRHGYFNSLPDGQVRVADRTRRLVTFNRLNLHEKWPVKGSFDAIFCRNVLIYFAAEAKTSIIGRFVDLLTPGGTLYLGHSESMLGNHPQLISKGRTIYRKCA